MELVAFDVGAAARQQKRSLAITFSVVVSLALLSLLLDDGFDDNRRSRTIFVKASAAAHACAEL